MDTKAPFTVHPGVRFWASVGLVAAAGVWALYPAWRTVWLLWTTDALRSVGMLIPPVSLVLACRAWTRQDWQGGSWWGLLPMAAALGASLLVKGLRLSGWVALGGHLYSLTLIPVSVIIALFVSGVVLLLGGVATWRKAAFPLLLLLLLNPVPHAFSGLVDTPLQELAARGARAFAALLDVPVSSDRLLKMMFAPQLGMFIAPGCDGLRGSVTLALIALVAGHLYCLRPGRWAAFVLAALLLAYVLNLLRLCLVVIYYWLALRLPAIGSYGTEVDYAIGGCVFVLGAYLFLSLPRRWEAAV